MNEFPQHFTSNQTSQFQRHFSEMQATAQAAAEVAMFVWIISICAALGLAIWIYIDAEARGKSGMIAALMLVFSGLMDLRILIVVLCAWLLLRPEKKTVDFESSKSTFDAKTAPIFDSGPSAEEFLAGLENINE